MRIQIIPLGSTIFLTSLIILQCNGELPPSSSYGAPPKGGPSQSYGPPPNAGPNSRPGSPPNSNYGPPPSPDIRPPPGNGFGKPPSSNAGGSPEGGSDSGNEEAQPEPFNFMYEVKDAATGTDFSHKQESDGKTVKGEYKVLLPDGRNQVVTYTADDGGYNAEVKYDGEAQPGGAPGGSGGNGPAAQGGAGSNGYPSGGPTSGSSGYPSGGPKKGPSLELPTRPSQGGGSGGPPPGNSFGGYPPAGPPQGGGGAPPNSYLPPNLGY